METEDGRLTFMLQRAGEASWPPWSIVCDILGRLGSRGLLFRCLALVSGVSLLICRSRCSYVERGRRRNPGSWITV